MRQVVNKQVIYTKIWHKLSKCISQSNIHELARVGE